MSTPSRPEWSALWAYQHRFEASELERIGRPPLAELHRRLCLHLQSEVSELLDCVDWKLHARVKPPDPYAVVEECVDVFKFLLNVCEAHGITEQQFLRAFMDKSQVVENRILIELMREAKFKRIYVSDLDGVLANRDGALARFLKAEPAEYLRERGAVAYHEHKDAWYAAGGFEDVAPYVAEVREFLKHSPRLICTTRDVRRYPQLAAQTLAWVRRHVDDVTPVLFAPEKAKALWWVPRGSIAVDDEEDLSPVCRCFSSWKEAANASRQ